MPKDNTDPDVDDVLRKTSPLHPPPKITANLKLDDDLDIGPITKRVLAMTATNRGISGSSRLFFVTTRVYCD